MELYIYIYCQNNIWVGKYLYLKKKNLTVYLTYILIFSFIDFFLQLYLYYYTEFRLKTFYRR